MTVKNASTDQAPATVYLVSLADAAHAGTDKVGVKAANVAELQAAGFPVPEGLVLTVDAFKRFVEANSLDDTRGPPQAATVPRDVMEALAAAIGVLGDRPLAVRSSGTVEDLPDMSFAGQYTTVLGVRGEAELLDAVRQCWASAFGEQVRAYQAQRGEGVIAAIAILIQRLVEADAAGVAFTANPVTGNREEVLVSAVRGLGERLVSGEASPDEWIVRENLIEAKDMPENSIGQELVEKITELARRAEQHFGSPQDIEWTVAGDDLYILQSRPITGLPTPISFEVPEGFWRRDSGHFSRPISPMCRSFYFETISDGITDAFRDFGALMERIECRDIGGHAYVRVVPLGGKEGPAPPWWLLAIFARIHPGARAAIQRAREAARTGKAASLVDRWWTTWRDELFREIQQISSVDLTQLSDGELDAHLVRTRMFVQKGNQLHFKLFVPYMLSVTDLIFFCRDHLGWDSYQTIELLSGLSEMSTEPSRRMAELATMARRSPRALEILQDPDDDTMERLRDVNPELATAVDAYQQEFGCRALGEDIIQPTLAEQPEVILALLKEQVDGNYDADRTAEDLARHRDRIAEQARQKLQGQPREMARFEQLLSDAQRAYPVREDNSFPTYQAPIGLMRYALLEAGRRLAERGSIRAREDVMFLEFPEVRSTLLDGGDLVELVNHRKRQYAWALANPGPSSYGADPGPPPDMRGLPVEARSLMEGLLWFIENDLDAPPVEGEGIRGIGASPGVYRGPVRIISNETEFYKLRNGDVLVCPITSPVWSVLFGNVGAMVTDTGGLLSHSAIIAREYGIPAVVNTRDATTVLNDGQIVTVDGTKGTVEITTGF